MTARAGRLHGKVAIVTGAGSGFGEDIAKKLVEEGAMVTLLDIDDAGGARVAGAIDATATGRARFIHCDVSRRADVAAAVRRVVDTDGRVDAYVNNAGITHRNQPMLDVSEDWFDRIFAVNVKGRSSAARRRRNGWPRAAGSSTCPRPPRA